MNKYKRVFLIVLDSLGVGALPDASDFGDVGSNTLASILACAPALSIPNLRALGLMGAPRLLHACAGKLREISRGKDTTTGHWEMGGLIVDQPFPTFPTGFPTSFLEEFSLRAGHPILGNTVASGTEIIERLGDAAKQNNALIVYTSADSVFQIAANEETIPIAELYAICEMARQMLRGDMAVGRVIARPYLQDQGTYKRTANRRDFSLPPTDPTMLDTLSRCNLDTIGIGKISDIFAGHGITRSLPTHSNAQGEAALLSVMQEDFHGLCFVNLVDFDMLYGHRRDAIGYGHALEQFDRTLGQVLSHLAHHDLLLITADHGCDPAFTGTDHTREYVPLLLYATQDTGNPTNLGTHQPLSWVSHIVLRALLQ